MIEKTLVGYCDPLSLAPGETVRFMVSCYAPGPYRADIVRLICGDTRPEGAGFAEVEIETPVSGSYPGREQPIYPGSYGVVEAIPPLSSFTACAYVWPTTPAKGWQAILGTWSPRDVAGFALAIAERGGLALRVGPQVVRSEAPLLARRWYFVGASYDAATGQVSLYQEPLPYSPGEDVVARPTGLRQTVAPGLSSGARPLYFAAWPDEPLGAHYNGKIDAPRLASRALSREEMAALAGPELPAALAASVVGFWDFARDIASERISDLSRHGLHGQTAQMPTRAMTGHNWTGAEMNWQRAPAQYGAIHFHDDDLYDAGWAADFSFTVPADLPSGVYAARLRLGDSDDYIPFFVRPPRGTATAPVAFLASTASYLAYANVQLFLHPGPLIAGKVTNPNDAMLLAHPEFGLSLYEHHRDGSGVHYSSRLRPILNLKPKGLMWSFNADSNITHWLEHLGQRFDVISDEDLHREGVELLARYRAVLTGTHPEYYSTAMLAALGAYLRGGGRLMYLGGNGFYWRIAYHPRRPGVIEVRRVEDGVRAWIAEPGEYYHAFNGEYGGLWRRQQRPPNRLVGVGFAAQGFDTDGSSYYRRKLGSRDPRARFIFEGVGEGDILGDFGSIDGGAAGQEIDRCDFRLGSPPHTLVLASSENHAPGMLRVKEEFLSTMPPFKDAKVRADLVFFECPNGGAVFSTGSIAYAGALAHNAFANDICRLTTNVLRRFLDPEPFELPEG